MFHLFVLRCTNLKKGTFMRKIVLAAFIAFVGMTLYASEIDLTKSKGTDQAIIEKLSPLPSQTDVWNNVKIGSTFNVPLDPSSIQKYNVKLVYLSSKTNEYIAGKLSYIATSNQIVFTPSTELEEGVYEVEIKSLKPIKVHKDKQIKEIKYRFYIPKVINGYQLPPEPDDKINNSTLLGIDFNNNGVRDDVERKIVIKYVQPIEVELMLSYAKAHQEMLHDPVGLAIESEKNMSKVSDCEMYLMNFNIDLTDTIGDIEKYTYNTKVRVKAYLDFNQALSGGVYGSSPADWNAQACDFDVEQMLKDR